MPYVQNILNAHKGGIGAVNLYRPLTGRTIWSHAAATVRDGCLTGSVAVTDPDGTVLAERSD